MRKAPSVWTVSTLQLHLKNGATVKTSSGDYPSRPEGLYSVKSRIKLAWEVFTGRADVLRWPGQQ